MLRDAEILVVRSHRLALSSLLMVGLTLTLSACGGESEPAASPPTISSTAKVRIALVNPLQSIPVVETTEAGERWATRTDSMPSVTIGGAIFPRIDDWGSTAYIDVPVGSYSLPVLAAQGTETPAAPQQLALTAGQQITLYRASSRADAVWRAEVERSNVPLGAEKLHISYRPEPNLVKSIRVDLLATSGVPIESRELAPWSATLALPKEPFRIQTTLELATRTDGIRYRSFLSGSFSPPNEGDCWLELAFNAAGVVLCSGKSNAPASLADQRSEVRLQNGTFIPLVVRIIEKNAVVRERSLEPLQTTRLVLDRADPLRINVRRASDAVGSELDSPQGTNAYLQGVVFVDGPNGGFGGSSWTGVPPHGRCRDFPSALNLISVSSPSMLEIRPSGLTSWTNYGTAGFNTFWTSVTTCSASTSLLDWRVTSSAFGTTPFNFMVTPPAETFTEIFPIAAKPPFSVAVVRAPDGRLFGLTP